MDDRRKLPPVWLMGLTNTTFGLTGGFVVVTLPQILASQGLSEGRIAAITAVILWPTVWAALISPILDVRFSRRTYAIISAVITALAVMYTMTHRQNTGAMEAAMVIGYAAASLYQGAVGGWMGSLIRKEDDARLGAWFTVSNLGAGGVMMLLGGEVVHRPPVFAAACLGTLLMLPTLLFLLIPAPGPDRRLARESFGRFFHEIFALLKRREVLIALMLFLLPSASFALTNILGGVGKDFAASEHLVSLSAGIGSTLAGIVGGLALQPLGRRFPLKPLYLGIGIVGSLFSLSLLLLPHNPAVFALAITGENLFQALAFATVNALIFETIGPNNPLAATQFTLLIAASDLPIVYMSYVDGKGYDWRGISGSFLADAGLSIFVCVFLVWALSRLRRSEVRS